ncbi:uncharacterized protein N7503_008397 [Penicillium pulvis]|uniref:uncharacterized protein n=1 Tax=Penicillium pulvis TaxID=1562058 RepID=UPI002548BC9F|nr:uncharacterized protein N7503_008397 [Penicillium pulvis]KAJ5792419.1 hypothetical protein N7503_008397 [Penicillium pulvis]
MFWFLLYVVTQVILLGAWVSGTLDPYQKRLQEIVLYMMGETKASYALKKSLTAKVIAEDTNLSKLQDQLGNGIGGAFSKGGAGEGVGSVLSKGL